MPADGQHELVLRRRDADGPGLLLAPVEEAAEPGAELEQPPVVVIVIRRAPVPTGTVTRSIVSRYY